MNYEKHIDLVFGQAGRRGKNQREHQTNLQFRSGEKYNRMKHLREHIEEGDEAQFFCPKGPLRWLGLDITGVGSR